MDKKHHDRDHLDHDRHDDDALYPDESVSPDHHANLDGGPYRDSIDHTADLEGADRPGTRGADRDDSLDHDADTKNDPTRHDVYVDRDGDGVDDRVERY